VSYRVSYGVLSEDQEGNRISGNCRDLRHDRACGSGNVIRPESPEKTPLDHWRVAIIRGAAFRPLPLVPIPMGFHGGGERGERRGGKGAVKQWDADKLGCVLETSWHSYRQTVVGARQMLLDCPESPRAPPFFPARNFRDEERSGEEKRRASPGLFLVSNTILTELDGATMASHCTYRYLWSPRPLQILRKVFIALSNSADIPVERESPLKDLWTQRHIMLDMEKAPLCISVVF